MSSDRGSLRQPLTHYHKRHSMQYNETFGAGEIEGGDLLSNTLVPALFLEVGASCVCQEAAEEGRGGGGGIKDAGGGGQEGSWSGWGTKVQLEVPVKSNEEEAKIGSAAYLNL